MTKACIFVFYKFQKNLPNSKELNSICKKRLKFFLANFFQLSFLKGISRILPLVTTPFLIRVIGMEKFGILEFAKAISFYFTIFVTYGFRYSATKHITLHKDDKNIIGQIVSSVYSIKMVIIFICILIMCLLIVFVPKIRAESTYLLGFFSVVVASSLFPTFAFQGLDKMRWLTSLNLVSKILFLTSLFIFIQSPSDAILFPIILAGVDMLRLIVALFVLYAYLKIPFKWPKWYIILQQIKEGIHIFLSQLAVMFYSRFPTIFLGFSGGPTLVAIYTLGDKITRITEGMLDPYMQSLYPIVYQKISTNLEGGINYIKHLAKISLLIMGAIGIGYWFLADEIINLLAGKSLPKAAEILRLHAFLPSIILISNLLGIGVLIPIQKGTKYTIGMLLTGILAIGLHIILVPSFQIQGAALAILGSEIFAALFLSVVTYRELIILKKKKHILLNESIDL